MKERVVVVTGGAGMLGTEYCRVLGKAGAHPVVADVDGEAAARLAMSVSRETGVRAKGVQVDVSEKESVQRMVGEVLTEYGRLDVLVNNAAIDPKFDPGNEGRHVTAFEDYPLELFNRSLAVNVAGAFLCAQAVALPMLDQGRGVIINVSSIYGMVGPDQRIYEKESQDERTFKPVDYSVSKSALLGLTRYLAAYWAGRNIRVNSFTLGGVFNDHDPEFTARYSARVPLGRMADRGEYGEALLFLASDASSYMTGANLVVDGGWTSW
ncbi:MAG: SDR family oxidoreductase [Gemmatimonadota bacterium]